MAGHSPPQPGLQSRRHARWRKPEDGLRKKERGPRKLPNRCLTGTKEGKRGNNPKGKKSKLSLDEPQVRKKCGGKKHRIVKNSPYIHDREENSHQSWQTRQNHAKASGGTT